MREGSDLASMVWEDLVSGECDSDRLGLGMVIALGGLMGGCGTNRCGLSRTIGREDVNLGKYRADIWDSGCKG